MSRLLVTGSRLWDGEECFKRMKRMIGVSRDLLHLLHPGEPITLVYGCAKGADDMAASIWWHDFDDKENLEPHPADWNRHGKAAGPIRNAEMVDLGADLCLAFLMVDAENRGTRDCMQRARAVDIPVIEVKNVPVVVDLHREGGDETMIPYPAEVARSMRNLLPGRPYVKVIPRDGNEARCPAYAAHHYELAAYYTSLGSSLDDLEAALRDTAGVYLVARTPLPETWPVRYRESHSFRPQVRALMRVGQKP